MPNIKLTNVSKRWKNFYAVDHLDLDIEDNAFITLLGPSGCGKTTTLRMIAGLETPTEGRITIGDKVVFDSEKGICVPPNKRKVGFLFQNYALWPNMTVYQNIVFGLNNIKEKMAVKDFEAQRISQMIKILENPEDFFKLVEDSKDKNGKIIEDKLLLKFIDSFIISMYSAKDLLSFDLKNDLECRIKVKELTEALEKIKASHKEKGEELNENFEIVADGKVVTKVRKLSKEEIDLSVRRVSRIVKIGMFMDRYPSELSGGQQQRVAIARTLAPEPQVLFMDEPLSNLDAKLRLEMRYELQRLHLETGSTFVYVTHDQMEAMTLATKICLMTNGVLQQYDEPLTVYNKPKNTFVADFVGNPSINFVEARGSQLKEGDFLLNVFVNKQVKFKPASEISMTEWFEKRNAEEQEMLKIQEELKKDKNAVEKVNKDEKFNYHIALINENDYLIKEEPDITNGDFILGIRPECIKIGKKGVAEGTIYGAMPTGMETTIKLAVGNFLLTAVDFGNTVYQINKKVKFDFVSDNILLFDRKSGKCICNGSLEVVE